jgi:cytochrome c oxidase subunit 2
MLALLLLILIGVSLWLFIAQPWWFPHLASERGADIDYVFNIILWVTGIAFVLTQGALAVFVLRYSKRRTGQASYWHDSMPLEISWTLGTAVILTILVFMGTRVWSKVYFSEIPRDALAVEATGEQFMWQIRYPGKDGAFGRTDVKFVNGATNPLGLDKSDPAAKDDIVSTNQMHAVVNRPVRLRLRSKDVIHSFFLPHFRVKQDSVPGMAIEIWFTPTKTGQFEIACAELCGLGHYRMRAFLTVESQAEFDKWLKEQAGG